MFVYVSILLMGMILYLMAKKIKDGTELYCKIMLVIMYMVSSFRAYNIGADYKNYIEIFAGIRKVGFKYPYEKGYVLLNMVTGMFTENYVAVGIVTNLILFLCLYWYMAKNVETKYQPLIIFIFFMNPYMYIQSSFNMIRQGCATAILLLGIGYLYEKKWCRYILVVLLAAQFHKAAYICLLLIGFRMVSWNKKKFRIMVCVTAALNLIISNIKMLDRLIRIFGFGSYLDAQKVFFDFKIYVMFVFCVVFFFSLYYEKLYQDKKDKFFIDLYLLSLSLLPVFLKNEMAYRVYVMLVFISLPALPIICKAFKRMKSKVNYLMVVSGYGLYYMVFWAAFLYKMCMEHNKNYVPFRFFWQV